MNNAKLQNTTSHGQPKKRSTPIVSTTFTGGCLVELLYDSKRGRTEFGIWKDGVCTRSNHITDKEGGNFVPYQATNNLIKHKVVLFPSNIEEYGDEEQLLIEIRAYIHRYVDISERFERIASYYVLLSWLHDGFNELPYLRLRGDYGSGKTRFLLTVGSLCYKPIFASGASTVSPIFHIIDAFGGTLVLDEGDFRLSDEKAEITKILNNGNVRGLPVPRTEINRAGEFNPRAFSVFGPKIIATRGYYRDPALESRFITEEVGGRRLRKDIPINLPSQASEEAETLRNKLLLFRFRNHGKKPIVGELADRRIEARVNQIFVPLLSVIGNEAVRTDVQALAAEYHHELVAARGMEIEAELLTVIKALFDEKPRRQVSIQEIAKAFAGRYGSDYERVITPKWIGSLVRKKLQLRPYKSNGIYVISITENTKLDALYERFGIAGEQQEGHVGS